MCSILFMADNYAENTMKAIKGGQINGRLHRQERTGNT